MRETEPKVFLIAHTVLTRSDSVPDFYDWLVELDGTRFLDHVTGNDPEQLIEAAARRCYKSFNVGLNPNVTKVRTDSAEYHANILQQAHGSVLEHSSATFAVEYCSRVFTHETVRHRAGFAYSQESLRYVRLTELGFRIPELIKEKPEAEALMTGVVTQLEDAQRELVRIFDIDAPGLSFKIKKELTSAFRRVAPIGLSTGIVITANFRALRWLIEHRTTAGVEEEMRLIVGLIAKIAVKSWPLVFGDFEEDGNGTWNPKYRKV